MIDKITIANYKSAFKTEVPLSAFTVLIGENGAGKSNILEALVLAASAGAGKLDTEYLNARGVRLCSTVLTKSAFNAEHSHKPIVISLDTNYPSEENKSTRNYQFILHHDDRIAEQWSLDSKSKSPKSPEDFFNYWRNHSSKLKKKNSEEEQEELDRFVALLRKGLELHSKGQKTASKRKSEVPVLSMEIKTTFLQAFLGNLVGRATFERFTVYSPTYDVLRNHLATPNTSPLGPRGEGLLATLARMKEDEPARYKQILDSLKLFGWFEAIEVPSEKETSALSMPKLKVKDRFVRTRGLRLEDASVNEGFLYVLFYLTLFCSSQTPSVFGVENIETALNPRLCEILVKRLIELGNLNSKQAIVTTHNPSVLDALNLDDPTQSLVIIRRNIFGHTVAERYKKPKTEKSLAIKLSEAFLRGHIGALPKGI